MFPLKIVITGLVVFAVVASSGCLKKKSSKDKEFAATGTAQATTTPAASQDIFDEFYKEDSAAKKSPAVTTPEPPARAPLNVAFSENGRFVVQVSTVRSRALADDITAKLNAKGYPAYVAEVMNPTPALSGTYYRIRIGGFTGISVARSFGENTLAAEGYEYWVDNRSNDNVGLQGDGMGGGDTYYTSQPAATTPDYQPSYAAPATPYQPPAEPAKPTPASSYTPESAAQEFETSPSTTTPAAGTQNKSEWGNEGW